MKTFPKLTLASLLATGLLLLAACTAESVDTPATAGTSVAPTPTSAFSTTTVLPDQTTAPVVTTTPQVTTTQQTPATGEPATSEPATSDPATTEEPAPATTEEPSLIEKMANMGCPETLIPTIEREANAEEVAKIQKFLADPYVIALLVDGFFTPEEIDLRGFIEMGVLLSDYTTPNGTPSPEEERDVALAIGD